MSLIGSSVGRMRKANPNRHPEKSPIIIGMTKGLAPRKTAVETSPDSLAARQESGENKDRSFSFTRSFVSLRSSQDDVSK
jgi:hypothetical protein